MEKQRILIVDDDPVISLSCRKILGAEGFSVSSTEDGESAIKKISNENFDLIIADIRLPDVSGLTVVRESKIIQPSTDIVVITGYPSLEDATESIRLGALEYLEKPFTPDFLLNTVKRLFDEKGWILRKAFIDQFKDYIVPASEMENVTFYYKDGTWARPLSKENLWEIGIDIRHFFVSGQLIYIEVFKNLKTVSAGEPFARLTTSDGKIYDIRSPLTGHVKMINEHSNDVISSLLKEYLSEGWFLWIARISII